MSTTKELVDAINAGEFYGMWEIEELDGMDGAEEVVVQDFDEYRWYTIGTVVYRNGTEFFGVRGVTGLKSETMGVRDAEVKCEAFMMEQVPSVTYKKIQESENHGNH